MRDPEFVPLLVVGGKTTANRGHGRKLFVAFVALAGVWMLCCSISPPRRSTCAACRLDRIDQGFMGFKWSKFEESDCSRWYTANVEKAHQHVWSGGGYCRRFGIPGLYGGYACSIGGPIAGLAKSFQLRVYQRFHNAMEAKQLFVRLGQWDGETQQLMEGLSEWMELDSPETWDEWWRKRRPIDQ